MVNYTEQWLYIDATMYCPYLAFNVVVVMATEAYLNERRVLIINTGSTFYVCMWLIWKFANKYTHEIKWSTTKRAYNQFNWTLKSHEIHIHLHLMFYFSNVNRIRVMSWWKPMPSMFYVYSLYIARNQYSRIYFV